MTEIVRKIFNLRPGEGGRVLLLCLFIFTSHACQAMGKVLQLSMFLDAYGRKAIPYAFLLSAAAVAVASLVFAFMARKVSRRRLVPGTLGLIIIGFILWRFLVFSHVPHGAFLLYIWVEVATILTVVLGWNYVNDACDPREGKRILPLASLGASLAFLINGFGVHPLMKGGLAAEDLSLFIVLILVFGILIYFLLERRFQHEESSETEADVRKQAPKLKEEEASGREGKRRLDLQGVQGRPFVFRSKIQRWGQSFSSGFSQIARSDLLRLFALVTVFAILIQQFLDYMFMSALRERFAKVELALFLGTFMGALGGAQIVFQLLITGRLLNRLGGAYCSVLEPIAVAVSSLLFVLFPGFWLLMGLRFLDRVFKTSFYSPSLQTLYTPVPKGQKIQAMALIKGFVSPLAKVAGAVALLFFLKDMSLRWMALVVVGFAVLSGVYLGLRAKKAYLKALHRALDRRKLTLDSGLGEDVPLAVDGTVLKMIRGAVKKGPEGNAVFALRFLEGAPLTQARSVIIEALRSPFSQVRREALSFLEDGGPAEGELIVGRGLSDEDGEVVLRALGALARLKQLSARAQVEELFHDERVCVAAGAAIWVKRLFPKKPGEAGKVLANLLVMTDPESRLQVAKAIREIGDESFAPDVKVLLLDTHEKVRFEALQAVGALHMQELVDDVFLCFESRGPEDAAEGALGKLGEASVKRLRDFIQRQDTEESVLRRVPWILAGIRGKSSGELLVELMSHDLHHVRLRSARALAKRWKGHVNGMRYRSVMDEELVLGYRLLALESALSGWDSEMGGKTELLLGQLRHRKQQVRRRLFALVGVEVGLQTADMILTNVESGQKRLKANAVELLENMTSPEISTRLVPMIEEVSVASKMVRLTRKLAQIYDESFSDPVGTLLKSDDLYLKAFLVHELGEKMDPEDRKRVEQEVGSVLPLIEKILFLKSAPIFAGLSGEELHRIAEITDEVSFEKGEVVFRQDDPGDAMYLILHGTVSIRVKNREVVRLGVKECFGEMALLDNLPRSADVVVAADADFLKIDADSFDELLEQKHAIVKGIFRVLTGRLREANTKGQQESLADG